MSRLGCIALTAGLVLGAYEPAQGFTSASFGPEIFGGTSPAQLAAFDAAVGISGFEIEDFEDVLLVPDLTVEYEGLGQLSSVPAADIPDTLPDAVWDGSRGLNPILSTAEPDLVFRIDGGALSVGIGVSDVEGMTRLFVNEQDLGAVKDLPNYSRPADNVREIYVRIDAEAGERIDSVRLSLPAAESADGLLLDRVAIRAVPEPATFALLAGGVALLAQLAGRRVQPS